MVNKVTFVGFRGTDRPNFPPGSAPARRCVTNASVTRFIITVSLAATLPFLRAPWVAACDAQSGTAHIFHWSFSRPKQIHGADSVCPSAVSTVLLNHSLENIIPVLLSHDIRLLSQFEAKL